MFIANSGYSRLKMKLAGLGWTQNLYPAFLYGKRDGLEGTEEQNKLTMFLF